MTRIDYLNTASDLRRAANWTARNRVEKIGLITRLLRSARNDATVKKILEHFEADKNPKEVFKNEKEREFFAEQLLVSASRLQNQS